MTLTATTLAIKCYEWLQVALRASPGEARRTVAVAKSSTFFSRGKRPLKFCLILRRCAKQSRNQRFACEVVIDAKCPADLIVAANEVMAAPAKATPLGD